jgi:threonine dehydrogenase-like Zn-dependent dehydrogenase
MDRVLAATTYAPGKTEIREYPVPEIPPDGGLLRIEAAGVCGTDWRTYHLDRPARIMGHENVGRIARLGSIAANRWGLKEGDRIALEEYLPCGHCELCRSGEFRLCEQTESRRPGALRYGTTPVSQPPGLWGGYSQYQFLHPASVFHRAPESAHAELLAMCIPLGNGFQWMCLDAGTGPGASVLIQGPGQQGLACVIAARATGASSIIVSGLTRDRARLEAALALGAHYAVDVEKEDLGARVMDLTTGRGVDLSIDTAGVPGTLAAAVRAARKGGKVLFAAASGEQIEPAALLDRRLTLQPCRGHSYRAVEMALELIQSRRFPLELLATHRFGLADVDLAIRSVGGEAAPGAIHVTVLPWDQNP